MKVNLKALFPLLCCVSLFITACNKKTDDPAPEETNEDGTDNIPKGMLQMHLHNYIEDIEVDEYNIIYTTSEGRKISLSMGQVYLSNIQLIKLDGSVYTIPNNVVVLKQQGQEQYLVADVPAGNYRTVRFNIGLDAATNQKSPSAEPSDPLNKPNMWFSSTAQPDGYVFANIQGKIDTTTEALGTEAQMQPFKYLIGTNANLRQRTMPDKKFTVTPNQTHICHMYLDITKLFNGIQLNNPNNLTIANPADNASTLAAQIANNLPGMFYYED